MNLRMTDTSVTGAVRPEYSANRRTPGMRIDFDRYSMLIDGERQFIRSGAMHYFRLPSRELWRDRLFKLKAAGYNCVDLYFCWNYHSPAPGIYDFTGIRDVQRLLEITQELGLYVIARPGPYINAEYSGGGFPGWLLAKRDLPLRNRREGAFVWSDEYMGYVREWWGEILPIVNRFDNVLMVQIENEYATLEVEPDYMQALYKMTRKMGVKVPLFHNDLYVAGLYSDVVDIYSFDNYSVTQFERDWREMPEIFQVLDNVEANLRPFCPESPLMVAELQAGWYGTWKGYRYDKITEYLGREHIGLTTKTVIGQGLTVVNHYKAIGGTNWNHTGSIETYTSYDFGAPISEAGVNTERLYEAKAINTFLKSFDLSVTERVDTHPFTVSDPDGFYLVRRNMNHPYEYWIFLRNVTQEVRHVRLDDGTEPFEAVVLPFEALILPYKAELKNGGRIDYATAEPFYQTENTLFFKATRPTHIKLRLPENVGEPLVESRDSDCPVNMSKAADGAFVLKCPELAHDRLARVRFGEYTVWLLGQHLVDTFWLEPGGQIVLGPAERLPEGYGFVREMETCHVIHPAGQEYREIPIRHPEAPNIPVLSGWAARHEALELYSDTGFRSVSTAGADFDSNGFYEGSCWYRYRLPDTVRELQLDARHIWAVFLNGRLLAHDHQLQLIHGVEPPPPQKIAVPSHLLIKGGENELVIFVDGLGHPKGFHDDAQTPEGLLLLRVDGQDMTCDVTFSPGFSSTKRELRMACGGADNPLPSEGPVVRFEASFDWPVDPCFDVPLGVCLNELSHFERVNIYLNDVLIGRYWRDCQRQDTFYLPLGVLKPGKNRLTLIVMSFDPFVPVDNTLLSDEQVCLSPYEVFTKVHLEATLES